MLNRLINEEYLDKISICEACKSDKVKYNGVGEYECEACHHIMLDDYGRVRNYIETHKGATVIEVSRATGISTGKVRRLVMEERIEIADTSKVFISCQKCGVEIKSGVMCPSCKILDAKSKVPKPVRNFTGSAGIVNQASSGSIHFRRDD